MGKVLIIKSAASDEVRSLEADEPVTTRLCDNMGFPVSEQIVLGNRQNSAVGEPSIFCIRIKEVVLHRNHLVLNVLLKVGVAFD